MERIQVTTSEGKQLRWSEGLTTYLVVRPNRVGPFHVSEWLATLAANELNDLLECLADFDEAESSGTETADIMNVVLITTSIETRQREVNVNTERLGELLDAFRLVATLEDFRRQGLIELPHAIGISSNEEVTMRVTDAGMAAGLNLPGSRH